MMRTSINDRVCYCASNLAYLVDGNGDFLPNKYPHKYVNNPYLKFVKEAGLQHVKAFANSSGIFWDKINAVIVMEFPGFTILAFRGTLPPVPCTVAGIQDWIQDFCLAPKEVNGYPGLVHAGIYDGYASLKDELFNYLSSLDPKSIWVTGHSKGGPMATYGVWDCLQKGFQPHYITTFASPRPGSEGFASEYMQALRQAHLIQTRYENDLDIVPFLPPDEKTAGELAFILGVIGGLAGIDGHPDIELLLEFLAGVFAADAYGDYTHVGTLSYITADHKIVPADSAPAKARIHQFTKLFEDKWFWDAFGSIGDAHLISIGHGYQEGVFPGIAAPAKS
ncbi:MAG: hypothetical protein AAFV95_27200 [Bacteroidota bacterium]